jgi:hypothetical protein
VRCLDDRFGQKRTWKRTTKFYEPADVADDVAVAFFLGYRDEAPKFAERCKQLNVPFVVIDLGWLRREWGFWQASVGGLNVAPPFAPAKDRYHALNLKTFPPRTFYGPSNCLVVGQLPGDAQHDLKTERQLLEWARSNVDLAKKLLPVHSRIFWRPHPSFIRPLPRPAITTDPARGLPEFCKEGHIQGAIVYNSTAGIELLRLGVHVVALGPRTVYSDIVTNDLGRLIDGHPGQTEVRSLLERLAYGQYKIEELSTWATFETLFKLHGVTGDW